jgi:predicted AAA+ superfamily ATPase
MRLDEIAESNEWWKAKENINNDDKIMRANESGINWDRGELFKLEEGLYSLRGPRQTGKSTWVKLRIRDLLLKKEVDPKSIFFLSCERIMDFNDLVEALVEYLKWIKKERTYIFLDEISFVKDWQRGLKYLIDRGDLAKSSIIVTGSSSLDLTKTVERLPGRVGEGKRKYQFNPMSFLEYIQSQNKLSDLLKKKKWIDETPLYIDEINHLLLDYCKSGGISRAVVRFVQKGMIPTSTYDAYSAWITGDLAKADKQENLSRQIIAKVIESYTTSLNWTAISKGTAAESHSTIADYADTMEKLFFLQHVYSYAQHKQGAAFAKNKKIYFSDPFLFFLGNYMTKNMESPYGFCSDFLLSKENQGKVIEGMVLNSIVAHLREKTQRDDFDYKNSVFFWSGSKGEVDFVACKGKAPLGVEVKWRTKPEIKETPFKKTLLLTEKVFDPEKGKIPIGAFLLDPGKFL